jgi:predicted amidohydrolase
MNSELKVHIGQMNSVDDLNQNVEQLVGLLEKVPLAKAGETQLVCFPENCLYLRLKDNGSISPLNLRESFWGELQKVAQAKNLVLHLGSVPLAGAQKLLNASVTVRPGQGPQVTYTKIHLFDIDVEGHKPVRESENFEHGAKAEVLRVADWVIGQSICYDLRFSELFSQYAKQKVELILVPSAFLVPTGQAHWEALLRARAIESQCYVVAAAQAGTHANMTGDLRKTYGHSMVISPWGEVLVDGGAEGVKLLSVDLQKSVIEKTRRQIPMHDHRRLT